MPVTRSRGKPAYRHLLLPTDGAPHSAHARKAAFDIARAFDAQVTAVHVIAPFSPQAVAETRRPGAIPVSPEEYLVLAQRRGNLLLRRIATSARRARVSLTTTLVTGADTAEAIADAARDHGCDLVVMATSNRSGFQRLVLGSVTSEVLARSPAPVLVCR